MVRRRPPARGDYKQSDYGKVVLPLTVLRRLECVLEPTREKVAEIAEQHGESGIDPDRFLRRASGHSFYNRSSLTLKKIAADPQNAAQNLQVYVGAFSDNARGGLDRFEFTQQIKRLDSAGLLYQVIGKFTDLDLRPEVVPNHNMGYIFEELIRRFAEQSNETAGEHFTLLPGRGSSGGQGHWAQPLRRIRSTRLVADGGLRPGRLPDAAASVAG